MAVLIACLGLISRSADAQGYAVDAVIPAVESGHADVESMGAAFARLFENDAYKLNRFGPVMQQIQDVSLLHRWWVARLVDEIVTQLEKPPRGSRYLYEAALESLTPLGARPSDRMAEKLAAHKGSSKTAKLARDLLALEGDSIDQPAAEIAALAWQGRVAFARSMTDL